MSTKSKIVLTLVISALAAAIVFGLLSFLEARKSLRAAAFDELTAINTARVEQVGTYFESVFDEALVISENPLISDAVVAFADGFEALNDETVVDAVKSDLMLRAYYEREVLPEKQANIRNGTATFEGFAPTTPAGRYLQRRYIAENPHGRLEREKLVRTQGGTAYESAHARFHAEIAHINEVFGYYDILLIDHETGAIVYSVRKEVDLGTNVFDGPFRASALGAVVEAVRSDPATGAVHMSDLNLYLPSDNVPALFIGAAIVEDATTLGILAIQLTNEDLNAIMTASGRWKDIGLKETGETYAVGTDFRMRSDSRFAAEDFEAYYAQQEALGASDEALARIAKNRSAVMAQEVRTEATRAALLDGDSDTRVITDYRGERVLSAFTPVQVQEHRYAFVAEMDAAEAFAPVRDLLVRTAVAAAIFVPVVALLGLAVASMLMRPSRQMRDTARRFLDGDESAQFQDQGSDEWGQLGAVLNKVLDTTRARLTDADSSRREVEAMTRTLMPRAIGERFAEGERKVVSAEGTASAAVFFLTPDPVFADLDNPLRARDLYEQLDDALDELATREGVDILNSAGMQFTAFCGLTSPIKNHGERLFRFCLAAKRAVLEFNARNGTDVRTMIGMDTGAMFGALIGNTAMAYEIWGPIVNSALDMAHHAMPGDLVMSHAALAQIGRDLPTEPAAVTTVTGETLDALRMLGFADYAVADGASPAPPVQEAAQ